MTGLLLSRRHRGRGHRFCIVCEDWVRNACAPFELTDIVEGKRWRQKVHICAPCLREGVKVATEGRKVKRRMP